MGRVSGTGVYAPAHTPGPQGAAERCCGLPVTWDPSRRVLGPRTAAVSGDTSTAEVGGVGGAFSRQLHWVHREPPSRHRRLCGHTPQRQHGGESPFPAQAAHRDVGVKPLMRTLCQVP